MQLKAEANFTKTKGILQVSIMFGKTLGLIELANKVIGKTGNQSFLNNATTGFRRIMNKEGEMRISAYTNSIITFIQISNKMHKRRCHDTAENWRGVALNWLKTLCMFLQSQTLMNLMVNHSGFKGQQR